MHRNHRSLLQPCLRCIPHCEETLDISKNACAFETGASLAGDEQLGICSSLYRRSRSLFRTCRSLFKTASCVQPRATLLKRAHLLQEMGNCTQDSVSLGMRLLQENGARLHTRQPLFRKSARPYESCVTCEWVMSHINQSCHI